MDSGDPDLEPLASLEKRIQRAVEMIPRLRQEREAAVKERETAVREAADARGVQGQAKRGVQRRRCAAPVRSVQDRASREVHPRRYLEGLCRQRGDQVADGQLPVGTQVRPRA